MKIEKQYLGKWIAIKNNKVVESDKTLTKLNTKVSKRKDQGSLYFTLVPRGFLAG